MLSLWLELCLSLFVVMHIGNSFDCGEFSCFSHKKLAITCWNCQMKYEKGQEVNVTLEISASISSTITNSMRFILVTSWFNLTIVLVFFCVFRVIPYEFQSSIFCVMIVQIWLKIRGASKLSWFSLQCFICMFFWFCMRSTWKFLNNL